MTYELGPVTGVLAFVGLLLYTIRFGTFVSKLHAINKSLANATPVKRNLMAGSEPVTGDENGNGSTTDERTTIIREIMRSVLSLVIIIACLYIIAFIPAVDAKLLAGIMGVVIGFYFGK